MFLLDGIGALVSAVFLLLIKFCLLEEVRFNESVLNGCISVALILLIIDTIAFLHFPKRKLLGTVAAINAIYASLSLVYLSFEWNVITGLGKLYLIAEILILCFFIYLEITHIKTSEEPL